MLRIKEAVKEEVRNETINLSLDEIAEIIDNLNEKLNTPDLLINYALAIFLEFCKISEEKHTEIN